MNGRETKPANGPDRERVFPCVCGTLRLVSRAVTQLYDAVLRPRGLLVTHFSIPATIARNGRSELETTHGRIDPVALARSLTLLQWDGVIERVPYTNGRIKVATSGHSMR